MSVKITDLGDAALPLTGNELFEVAVSLQESRKLSVADLMSSAPGMDASFVTLTVNPTLPNERVLTAGANISVVDGGPGTAVTVAVLAALTGVSVNGVTLSNAGVATNFLDETGNYSAPAGGGDVFKVGVPVNNQVGVWTGDGTIEGDVNFIWDTATGLRLRGGRDLFINTDDDAATALSIIPPAAAGGTTGITATGGVNLSATGATNLSFLTDAATRFQISGVNSRFVFNDFPLFVEERAAAGASVAAFGQFWVRDDVPNVPMFTNDAGADFVLNAAGAIPDPLVIGSVNATSNAAINSSDNVAALNIGNTAIPGTLPIMQINSQFIQSKSSKFSSGATIFINNLGGDIQLGNANFASITINAPASGVQVKHSTAAVAFQSALPASGGLFANNLATGAGLERVLTTADLGGGASPGGANTAIQFNSAGAFGGTPNFEWDGSIMKIEASQAAIILDETDGGGTCFLRLTSTATGDSALVLEWSSSSGTNGAIRQATSSGTLQDTWINFFKDAGVGIRFNGVQKMITLATGVKMEDSIYIEEKAAANADTVTEGQVWVRTDTFSNTLMFTNDNGNDFEVAGLPLGGDVLDGTLILADTTFVGVVNIGPKPDSFYMLQYAGMVSAPAADDIKIRLIMDTASLFIGTLTDSTGQVTGLISAIGSALTNEVIIDTDGSAIPAGQTFTIQGHLHTGATAPGTMSLQAAKNADAGADGSIYFAAVAVKAMYDA